MDSEEDRMVAAVDLKREGERMGKLVDTLRRDLTEEERKVLDMRLGLSASSQEVEGSFSVTRERIREIEEKALRKLRAHLPGRAHLPSVDDVLNEEE